MHGVWLQGSDIEWMRRVCPQALQPGGNWRGRLADALLDGTVSAVTHEGKTTRDSDEQPHEGDKARKGADVLDHRVRAGLGGVVSLVRELDDRREQHDTRSDAQEANEENKHGFTPLRVIIVVVINVASTVIVRKVLPYALPSGLKVVGMWGMGIWPEFYFKCASCKKMKQTIYRKYRSQGPIYFVVCSDCQPIETFQNPPQRFQFLCAACNKLYDTIWSRSIAIGEQLWSVCESCKKTNS